MLNGKERLLRGNERFLSGYGRFLKGKERFLGGDGRWLEDGNTYLSTLFILRFDILNHPFTLLTSLGFHLVPLV